MQDGADADGATTPSFGGSLRRSSAGTLHHQLYRTLHEMIDSGVVKPGDKMPTETELTEAYGISRTTARRALDDLRRQGLVERTPGRGTFVRPRRDGSTAHRLYNLRDEIERLGYATAWALLSVEFRVVDEAARTQLQLPPDEPVVAVRREWTADGEQIYVEECVVNTIAFPELRTHNFALGMYRATARVIDREYTRATLRLTAVRAPDWVRRHLGITASEPVMRAERTHFASGSPDDGEVPTVYASGYFIGRLYEYQLEFSGSEVLL